MHLVSTHHISYGTLRDYLTGECLNDTDDERIRQDLSRYLVEELGYDRTELTPRRCIETTFNSHVVRSCIELALRLKESGRIFLIIRYGPGSLVSRERSALAAARVLEKGYQIPYAVVTNGSDALLLDTQTGAVLATGMEAIPSRERAEDMGQDLLLLPPAQGKKRTGELRILNAFDVATCCRGL